eukprot:43175-Prorocentrum_minimum.AAC.1
MGLLRGGRANPLLRALRPRRRRPGVAESVGNVPAVARAGAGGAVGGRLPGEPVGGLAKAPGGGRSLGPRRVGVRRLVVVLPGGLPRLPGAGP